MSTVVPRKGVPLKCIVQTGECVSQVDSLTRRTSLSHLSPSADPVTSKQKAMGKVSEVPLDILPVGSASSSTPVGVEHRRASFAGHQVELLYLKLPRYIEIYASQFS